MVLPWKGEEGAWESVGKLKTSEGTSRGKYYSHAGAITARHGGSKFTFHDVYFNSSQSGNHPALPHP